MGIRYFTQYMQTVDPSLAKMVKCFKSIEKYRQKVVPKKKHKKALKIFKKFVQKSEHVKKELQNQLADKLENFDFKEPNIPHLFFRVS